MHASVLGRYLYHDDFFGFSHPRNDYISYFRQYFFVQLSTRSRCRVIGVQHQRRGYGNFVVETRSELMPIVKAYTKNLDVVNRTELYKVEMTVDCHLEQSILFEIFSVRTEESTEEYRQILNEIALVLAAFVEGNADVGVRWNYLIQLLHKQRKHLGKDVIAGVTYLQLANLRKTLQSHVAKCGDIKELDM